MAKPATNIAQIDEKGNKLAKNDYDDKRVANQTVSEATNKANER